jgi:membrane-associated phospholipid phosphatase
MPPPDRLSNLFNDDDDDDDDQNKMCRVTPEQCETDKMLVTRINGHQVVDNDNRTFFQALQSVVSDGTYTLRAVAYDWGLLHYSMLNPVTAIIFIVGFTLHQLALPLDDVIQQQFYDSDAHKNIHQLPGWFVRPSKRGIKWFRNISILASIWPIAADFKRDTALMFVQGSMWMSLVKRGLKMFADRKHYRGAKRPPNEHFIRGIYYGGFPSGHMSQSGFAVALHALNLLYGGFNYTDAIVLGLLSLHAFMAMAWLIASNRHYLSQTIAGFSLGIAYAFAALAITHNEYPSISLLARLLF